MVIPTGDVGPEAAVLEEKESSQRVSGKKTKIHFTLDPLIMLPNLVVFKLRLYSNLHLLKRQCSTLWIELCGVLGRTS